MTAPASLLRVLVVDDSAQSRKNIAELLVESGEVEVVGRAADGEEALRLASQLRPDVITLDLEMPKMDGFTFLRILMARQPTPVIVVSSHSAKEQVFRALELGALDFVAKPELRDSRPPSSTRGREQATPARGVLVDAERVFCETLLAKVSLARRLVPQKLVRSPSPATLLERELPLLPRPPRHIVVVAASTGGPGALLELFARLPERVNAAFLIAQHMPDRFTRTFADRLDRKGAVRVVEAQEGDLVVARKGYVCPGGQSMELVSTGGLHERAAAPELRLALRPSSADDRYVPSADRLFTSAASIAGSRTLGVVLTGMGDDGTAGARAIVQAGGVVVVESEESAVVYGMPGSVVRAGLASDVLPLSGIVELLGKLQ
jgi:two-component system chemotaxis response regulator CheB